MTTPDVLRLAEDLATQLRAGAAPQTAWRAAVELLPQAVAVADQPRHVLARLAGAAGAPAALQSLHAAWALSDDVGAPLADVLGTVAAAIRQDGDVEADIEAALAAPRSTARLLAVLPLAGLGLGELIGAHPLAMLLHTAIGRVCAVLGLALAIAGQWWTRRLVARAAALL
jgi:tight adherence protein B